MKKLLLILLIVAASSETVTSDASDLESWLSDILDKLRIDCIKCAPTVSTVYDYLVKHGYLKQLINTIEKYGKPVAIELCSYWSAKPKYLCTQLVELLFPFIKDNLLDKLGIK